MFGTIAVVLEVEAGAERPARSGEHDHPRVVLLGDRVERVVELDTSSIDIALSRSGRCIRTTATCGRGCSTSTKGDASAMARDRSGPRRVGSLRSGTSDDAQAGRRSDMADEAARAPRSRTTSSRTAPSRRRRSSRRTALVAVTVPLRRGRRGLAGLLGPPGRRAARLVRGLAHDPRVGPAVRQVVRRRQAQRLPQLPRPPRRGRAAATRSRTTGRASPATPAPSPTPTCTPRCSASPTCSRASASRKGDRVCIYMPMIPELPVAMLACARIGARPLGGLRRLHPRLAHRPHQRRRVQGASSPPTAASAAARRRCSSPTSTPRWRPRPSIEHVVVVQRVDEPTSTWQDGRDHWWHDLMADAPTPSARASRWTARTCSTCSTPRAPRPSPRASCTPPAATSPRWRSPTSTSSTCTPTPTSTGARPTSAGSPATATSSTARSPTAPRR